MELGKPEALGVFNDHQRGVGNVHAHFDDGGGNENADLAGNKGAHHDLFLSAFQLAVQKADPRFGKDGGKLFRVGHRGFERRTRGFGVKQRGKVHLVGRGFFFLNGRADHVDLTPVGKLTANKLVQAVTVAVVHNEGVHALAAGRKLVNFGKSKVTVKDQGKRAGNGRCAHYQQVRVLSLLGKHGALAGAEAVLFVGNHQAGRGKLHPFGEQGVRADDEIDPVFRVGRGQSGTDFAFFGGRGGSQQERDPHAQAGKEGRKIGVMLARKNFGGRHERRLTAGLDRDPDRGGGANRFAAANVANDHAAHGNRACKVGAQFGNHALLRPGQAVGKQGKERVERFHAANRRGRRGGLAAHEGHTQRKIKKFLVNQPPPRLFQVVLIQRTVQVFYGIGKRQKVVLGNQFVR